MESHGLSTDTSRRPHVSESQALHITRLVETNYKRISSLDVTPGNRTLVIYQGPNEAGKTSALEGLIAALGGKRKAAEVPIRAGADDCIIEATIGGASGNKYHVVRSFKGDKAYLSVYSLDAEGRRSKESAGQTLLDSLVSDITFDPLQFVKADRNTQTKMLCAAIGRPDLIDQAKARKDALSETRRLINSRLDGLKARLNTPDLADPAPGQPLHEVTPDGVKARMATVEQANQQRREQQNKVEAHRRNLAGLTARIESLQRELSEVTAAKDRETANLAAAGALLQTLPAEVSTADLAAQLQQIESENRKARQRQARAKALAELGELQAKADSYTSEMAGVDAAVEATIAASDLGKAVPGITFKAGELLHNGLPWSQASGMRKLELSTLIGMAANPALRIMTIDEADRLDDASLKRLQALAAERQFQLWLTGIRLGDETDEDTCIVKIIDGKSVSVNGVNGSPANAEPAAAIAVGSSLPEDFEL